MKIKKWLVIPMAIVLILVTGSLLYLSTGSLKPMQQALDAMQSDAVVEVINSKNIVFNPIGVSVDAALIIYPGGKVDPRAYAPAARAFAEKGVRTIIVKMPFNLAIFGSSKADQVIEQNSDIKKWYISGHSLGGVMAARYTKAHQDIIKGLIFWAAYPEEASDLSAANVSVMSIYGTNDGLVEPGKMTDTAHLLPQSVQWVSITGGNHSQFGWYGFQEGDEQATITREEQQQEIIESTLELVQPFNSFNK